jgi:triosephosphate isomerase
MKTSARIVGNWKMNLGVQDSRNLAQAVFERCASALQAGVHIGICPSACCLSSVSSVLGQLPQGFEIGTQNLHWDPPSAQTGETSLEQAKELGATFTLLGHSERRHGLGESQALVDTRALGVLKRGFPVLLCVGETLQERESGKTEEVLHTQVLSCLNNIPSEQQALFEIAYEPVWAIGTGKVARISEIESAHAFLCSLFEKSPKWNHVPRVLYGGSVKPDNFAEIIKIPTVSGALVGGASLDAASFAKLAELAI